MAIAILIPIIISLIMNDGMEYIFLQSAAIASAWALALIWVGKGNKDTPRSRDGLATVGLAWLMIGILGAIPYWISGTLPNFWDGIFESFSGLTTTGATVIGEVEKMPPAILFWRSLTHWLGGMGIIVLMLAVLPFFGLSGVHLFKNESSLGQNKIKPRIAETAKILWFIYTFLTLLLLALLLLGGMGWFDALCHTFSTISTGGFSNRNISVGHFESAYFEVVITIFMFLGALNFALYYTAVRGNWKDLLKNTEVKVFIWIILISSILIYIPLQLNQVFDGPWEALRHSFFQVVSVISTTGLTTTDWEQWPYLTQGILLTLFFIGGCAGSTSGGMKCIRWVLLFKVIHRTLRQHIHPRAILPIRLGNQAVPEPVMTAIWSFATIYLITLILSTLALAAMDIDLLTALSASASTLGNVGLGLSEVGPSNNFGHLPGAAKGILSFCMVLGRLELFAIMILFLPEFWRK